MRQFTYVGAMPGHPQSKIYFHGEDEPVKASPAINRPPVFKATATKAPAIKVDKVLSFEEKVEREWASSPDIRRRVTFHALLTRRKAERTEPMIELYQLKHGCSYKEALLAVSKRHPQYFR